MPTLLLVRHGRTAANAGGVLAGWTPGVGLDDTGREQAQGLARRMAPLPLVFAVSSPLQRCQETATAVLSVPQSPVPATPGRGRRPSRPPQRPTPLIDDRLGECRYGDWTNRPLAELAKEPLWRVVQAHPSAAVFPGPDGESLLDMQHRAVSAVREHDARVAAEHGDGALWIALSHGDVIKAILADALGMHLDAFQRIVVEPCSVSVIRFTPLRPFVVRMNDTGAELASLVPAAPAARRRSRPRTTASTLADASDAVIGGSTGGGAAVDVRTS